MLVLMMECVAGDVMLKSTAADDDNDGVCDS